MLSTLSFILLEVQAQAMTMVEICTPNKEKKEAGLSFGDQVLTSKRIEDYG